MVANVHALPGLAAPELGRWIQLKKYANEDGCHPDEIILEASALCKNITAQWCQEMYDTLNAIAMAEEMAPVVLYIVSIAQPPLTRKQKVWRWVCSRANDHLLNP